MGHDVPDVLVMSGKPAAASFGLSVQLIFYLTVFVGPDETDPYFWAQAREQGWVYINHTQERTIELYGEWYAPLVDIVVQSLGVGFVGTDQSTFSLVSKRRVEDWNNGATRWVVMPPL